jgi:sec-independent protein translocase protein TatA
VSGLFAIFGKLELIMGGSEILLILVVALLLFGSNKIPDIARMLGKGLREFNKAKEDIKREINNEVKDVHENIKDLKKDLNNNDDNFVI